MAMNAWLTLDVGRHIFGKHAETAARQTNGAVRMSTGAPPRYFAKSPFKSCRQSCVDASLGQSGHIVGNGREPENARSTLTGALVGQIVHNPR
jgi:hypothetical protein